IETASSPWDSGYRNPGASSPHCRLWSNRLAGPRGAVELVAGKKKSGSFSIVALRQRMTPLGVSAELMQEHRRGLRNVSHHAGDDGRRAPDPRAVAGGVR